MMTTDQATPALNPRVAEVVQDVVGAVADVIRNKRVTYEEYRRSIAFLEEVVTTGELPLLTDVFLGVAVDDTNYPANGGTESNLEGPFYVPDAPLLQPPYVLPSRSDEPGDVLFFSGTVSGLDGRPLGGAMLDMWQANGAGQYSHFSPDVPEFNLRGRFTTDADGRFEVRTVLPAGYSIPSAGPTGRLLASLGRHFFRPSHLHVRLSHPGYTTLTTQIYFEGDAYLDSDVVGAVKDSLVVRPERHEAPDDLARASLDRPFCACSYHFVLQPQTGVKAPSLGTPGGLLQDATGLGSHPLVR
jgi:catechol 1,2-dioxygenase